MAAAMAADAMVPSRPSPRKDQVVDQAKKFQKRASSCPALWNRNTMPAASASSAAAASALSARVTACAWGLGAPNRMFSSERLIAGSAPSSPGGHPPRR